MKGQKSSIIKRKDQKKDTQTNIFYKISVNFRFAENKISKTRKLPITRPL